MEPKLSPTKGILVHGLPRQCQREALDIFAGLSLRYHSQDELGLRIYFEHFDCARKTILWQRVMVGKKSYDIYPLVTNVTIRGIRCYANKMEIKRLVEPYGPVIDLYVVNSTLEEEHTRHRTVSMTDDYRVILDVPEVQAGYHLNPVVLPGVLLEFPILFFCRLCRRDGHKQSQCRAAASGNVAVPLLMERRESHERCPKVTRPESDGSEVDHTDGYLPDQTDPREYSPGISSGGATSASSRDHDNSIPKSCSFGMRQKTDHRNPPSRRKDCAAASSRSTVSQSLHRFTKYRKAWRGSTERPRICHPPNLKNFPESTPQKSAPSASSIHSSTTFIHSAPSPNQLHPHKIHRGASKDIRIPKKKDEISRPSKRERENLKRVESPLQRDCARCQKNSTISKSHEQPRNSAEDSTDAKMDRLGCQSRRSNSSTEDAPSRPKCCNTVKMESRPVEGSEKGTACRTEGGDPSTSTVPKKARRRRTSISQGVLGIMKEVQGELNPVLLENFLKQVRGRRKAADMARYFTANIPGLICQLREVEKSYYVSGKRGGEEDVDIRYIRDLYLRLERDLSTDCHPHTPKKESESTKLVIKQEPA